LKIFSIMFLTLTNNAIMIPFEYPQYYLNKGRACEARVNERRFKKNK
jgi:hypothetical protein